MTEARLRAMLAEVKAENRSRILSVRLAPAEYARLERAAKGEGIPAATLGRVLVLAGLAELQAEKGGKR